MTVVKRFDVRKVLFLDSISILIHIVVNIGVNFCAMVKNPIFEIILLLDEFQLLKQYLFRDEMKFS